MKFKPQKGKTRKLRHIEAELNFSDLRPMASGAKSTNEPNGYPCLRWCIRDITVHKWANLAYTQLQSSVQSFLSFPLFCLSFPKIKILGITCSIRLRTARAGRGRPWAEVALWTPPDIGVLNSPALVPPPVPLPDPAVKGVTTFEASPTVSYTHLTLPTKRIV